MSVGFTIDNLKNNTFSVTAAISGEIDHHTAKTLREKIDNYVDQKNELGNKVELLNLDFSAVTFTDSSGIGLILGRYKHMNNNGGRIKVVNIPQKLERMIKLGGLMNLGIF